MIAGLVWPPGVAKFTKLFAMGIQKRTGESAIKVAALNGTEMLTVSKMWSILFAGYVFPLVSFSDENRAVTKISSWYSELDNMETELFASLEQFRALCDAEELLRDNLKPQGKLAKLAQGVARCFCAAFADPQFSKTFPNLQTISTYRLIHISTGEEIIKIHCLVVQAALVMPFCFWEQGLS